MANPKVIVDFVANTASLQSGLSQAGSSTDTFGGKVKGLARAGVVAAGAAGLAALTGTLKVGVDELTEASKVAAQTGAVIKSTGGAANVSAKQVSALAGALMEKTGVDDEAIQSGENVLLTFTRIRNEAGKGNDIFNQATKATLDLSVALGQDMKQSSIQVGKALNDPIKGVTALQRVGVTFTKGQKDQIAAMVEAGDTMGAQKVILAELNKEFGGSAEAAGKTLPGQINILKESFANFAGILVSTVAPALTTITSFFVKHPALAKAMVIGVLALAAAMVALNVALAVSSALAAPYILLIVGIGAAIAGLIVVAVLLAKNWDKVVDVMTAGFNALKSAANSTLGWLKANWPAILAILAGPIGVAVLVLARHWNDIKSAVVSSFNAVKGAIGDAAGWVRSTLTSLGSWISGFASGALSTAISRVRAVFDRITDAANDVVHSVKSAMNGVVNAIESIIGKVRAAASSVANAIKAPINAVINAWNGLSFRIPEVKIPSIKIGKKRIGGGGFGGQTINFPNITPLQAGGIVTAPTLALLGEAGPEAVVPLRDLPPQESRIEVRVFIGATELTDIVRTEIVAANTGIARTLLAGGAR